MIKTFIYVGLFVSILKGNYSLVKAPINPIYLLDTALRMFNCSSAKKGSQISGFKL